MKLELAQELERVIDEYNEEADEHNRLYWCDVLCEIKDVADDDEVISVIIGIERQAEKLQMKRAAGL